MPASCPLRARLVPAVSPLRGKPSAVPQLHRTRSTSVLHQVRGIAGLKPAEVAELMRADKDRSSIREKKEPPRVKERERECPEAHFPPGGGL